MQQEGGRYGVTDSVTRVIGWLYACHLRQFAAMQMYFVCVCGVPVQSPQPQLSLVQNCFRGEASAVVLCTSICGLIFTPS